MTWPLKGRLPSVVPTRTSWPSLISLARCSGTVKSTFMDEILEARNDGSRLEILADIDARNADDAGERRLESLLLDGRLNACETGAGGGEQGARLIEVGLGAVAARRQGLGRARSRFGRLHGRLHVLDVGALDRVVELHQDLALANLLVGLELDLA